MSAKRRLALLIGICTLLLVAFLGMGVAQASAATLSGTLTDATTHAFISDGTVRLYDTAGFYHNIETTTNDHGYYEFTGLAAGDYKVLTWSSYLNYVDQWYNDHTTAIYQDDRLGAAATVLTVGAGATTGIDFTLSQGQTISGTVTDAITDNPIPNLVLVTADDGAGWSQTVAVNSTNGFWIIGGLLPDSYKMSTYNNQGYIDQWYQNVAFAGNATGTGATPVVLTLGGGDVPNIDFALSKPLSISGTLTDAVTLAPISNGTVRLYDSSGHYTNIETTTDDSGFYSLTGVAGLAAGDYKVLTWSSYLNYVDQWYNDHTTAIYQDDRLGSAATTLTVGAGAITGIDFALNKGHSISGTVTDAVTHDPIPDLVLITATDATGWSSTVAVNSMDSTYIIGGLLPGAYKMSSWNDQGYIDQWYQNVPFQGNPSGLGATPVTLVASNISSIDFALSLSTPAGMLTSLKSLINIPAFGVDPGVARILTADVNAALRALARGGRYANLTAATELRLLVIYTRAQPGRRIAPTAATEIVKQANAIIAALGK